MKDNKAIKKDAKHLREYRQRIFRVVEYLDFSALIERSPVQVLEGYVVSDIMKSDLFASFTFQNLSPRQIKSLTVRLFLYDNTIVPYERIVFTYSYPDTSFGYRERAGEPKKPLLRRIFPGKKSEFIDVMESFGKATYIKIPETYFKKIELEIAAVEYSDGTKEQLGIVVANKTRRFEELDEDSRYAFDKINIYREAEAYHPTKVIPTAGDNAWLCCCGYKNLASDTACRSCKRDRDWQFSTITDDALGVKVKELKRESDMHFRDKTNFKQYEKKQTKEEIQKKIKDYERVMQNIAEDERRKQHNKMMILPRILIYFAAMALIVYIISLFAGA